MAERGIQVRFVAAPFLPEHQPALGVSSLKAVLAENGIASNILYLNIDYANYIGKELHGFIANANPPNFLVGEMVFSAALWGDDERRWRAYVDCLADAWNDPAFVHRKPKNFDCLLQGVRSLQIEAPSIVERWARSIMCGGPRIVGFSTTFQQNVASLAIAKELRKIAPSEAVTILFGGANCEGDMGRVLARKFSFIDHVISGEGENQILEIVKPYLEPGIGHSKTLRFVVAPMVADMNQLPIPNFDDYFNTVSGTEIGARANLAAESSRGCWWGMKSHCTFCGLNGQTMNFRSKTPARFSAELKSLSQKYGQKFFVIADNILDMKYVSTLFPELAVADTDIRLFYETKANLRKDQLEVLVAGGTVRLQPGIESLSTPILKLMGKGTSRLQNIQLLKWCREFKIEVAWNLSYGFPGENPDEYASVAELIPHLTHLQAPIGSGQVRIDRFSPYWRTPERFGIANIRHFWSYEFAYPRLSDEDLAGIAYYFENNQTDFESPKTYCASAVSALDRWRELNGKVQLEFKYESGELLLIDTRGVNDTTEFTLNSTEIRLLRALDAHRHRQLCICEVCKNASTCPPATERECELLLDSFLERGWVICEGDQLLSLVVDPRQFQRVIDRLASLALNDFGLV